MMIGVHQSLLERLSFFFFFQAEDGIRDYKVTGVQTCALPIWRSRRSDPRRGRRMGGGPRPCVRTDRSLRGDERARMKREPRRTCLGCRRVGPKQALVRLVRGRGGVVVADPRRPAAGRGAYVGPADPR